VSFSVRAKARSYGTNPCPTESIFVVGGKFRWTGPGGTTADPFVIKDFCIDELMVSTTSYDACARNGTCPARSESQKYVDGNPCYRQPGTAANCVSNAGADAYCRSVGKTLPTEEEWVLAVRGRQLGRAFPSPMAPDPVAVARINAVEQQVAQADPTLKSVIAVTGSTFFRDLGLGGYWEWTASRFATPPGSASVQPGYAAWRGWYEGMAMLTKDVPNSDPRLTLSRKAAGSWSGAIGFRCLRRLGEREDADAR
jgi:formylglycine-generating enzyme required for sulfatase activity